ncbi:hypothetical protein BAU28_19500 [Bacillus paramycoides]|uniref:Uncharacterized protein n=1 Tax=Bacillus paramycoides TaxID=2026194 RepID=A0A1J9U003_9BACI|nr:hypothetical protein BAU28_19500 [Bacillus paramycoides]
MRNEEKLPTNKLISEKLLSLFNTTNDYKRIKEKVIGKTLTFVPDHSHQAKILKYPLNGNFVFFIAPKFILIVLGKNVFLNLIAMWWDPIYIINVKFNKADH